MAFSIDDNLDPNNLPLGTNIKQALNILATQVKQLSGKQTWRTKPDYSIATAIKGDKGDKGDTGATGAQGIQGDKGDKGDPGEPAPINHTHAIAQVTGLQAALDSKVATHPGFVSGKYYASASFYTSVSVGLNPNYIFYSYFFVPTEQTFNKVAFLSNTTFSTTQNVRLAIYKVVNGLPLNLVANLGEISFLSSGIKEISYSLSLSAGWYAIAFTCSPNINSVSCPGLCSSLVGQASPITTPASGYSATFVYNIFPSEAPLNNLTATYSPIIWMKAA